jgi:N-acetylglucosamine-6-sulfatase
MAHRFRRHGWPAFMLALTLALVGAVAWSTAAPRAVDHADGPVEAAEVSGPVATGEPVRPNLILIVTDDQRWDTLWAMPNVRRLLGAHGVTFSNAFVTTSLCCPSRVSLLTGQYSRHTGVYDGTTWPPHGGAKAFDDRSSLATWLKDAGYTTALVGKYLNGYEALGSRYIPPGWDEWDAVAQSPEDRYFDYTLNENGRLVHYGRGPSDYSTTVLTGHATRFIQAASDPFFLYLAPLAPHVPSTPAPGDEGAFADLPPLGFVDPEAAGKPWAKQHPPLTAAQREAQVEVRRKMYRSLLAVDRSVAEIVAALEAKGLLDRTVIAFTSDNGYLWGEHRLTGKVWPYEESIRVPLVIRAPWVFHSRVDDHLVLNIDIASTFARLAGIQPGLPQDGSSLLPLLGGRPASWREAFVVEYLGVDVPGLPPRFDAVRTERYLWIEYENGWRELYDVRNDPLEVTNLAGTRPGLQHELARTLKALLR